jgi:hypothetical protein
VRRSIIAIVFFTSIDLPRTELKLNSKENNTIDYGIITKGRDNGIRVFEFTNTGTTPLIIYAVNPQQAPLSYQNKRTLFYQGNQVKLK